MAYVPGFDYDLFFSYAQDDSAEWIRALEQMNSVHPYHKPEHFADCRHFILTFHDTIFECIAGDYSVEQPPGSLRSILPELVASL